MSRLSVPLAPVAGALALWVAGAIYYDTLGAGRWGRPAVAAWLVGVVAAFACWQPTWQPFAALLGVTSLATICMQLVVMPDVPLKVRSALGK